MSSIRKYLTIRQLVAFELLFCSGAALLYVLVQTALVSQFDAALQTRAAALQSFTKQTAGGLEWEPPPAGPTVSSVSVTLGLFEIRQTNGQLFRRSEGLGTNALAFSATPMAIHQFFNLALPNGEPGRALRLQYTPFADRTDRRPPHVRERQPKPVFTPVKADLVVAASRVSLDNALKTIQVGMAITGAFFLAGTVLIVTVSLRQGLAPLDQLASQAERINASSLQTRFPTESMPQELLPISLRLNDLLVRLEKAFKRERQFSADVAHELRTPIGELRTLAEVALQVRHSDASTHEDMLAIALQMEGIVDRLFHMARCEQEQLPLRPEPVVLAEVVSEMWKPFATSAHKRGLTAMFDLPPGQRVHTDPWLLRTIISNLLSNAVEYAPPGSHISVQVHPSGPRLSLAVTNLVDRLTVEDLPHLFEKFWRKDDARASSVHCGLGLAVSQTFARHLGCCLNASFSQDNRLMMSLSGLVAMPECNPEKP